MSGRAPWVRRVTVAELQHWIPGTALEALGIEFTGLDSAGLEARMPVDRRTVQPMGLLHGGASALLAETLASVAGTLCVPEDRVCVGVEINASHLRPARSGWVYGRAEPVRLGRRLQVWDVRVRDEAARPVCASRVTLAVVEAGA